MLAFAFLSPCTYRPQKEECWRLNQEESLSFERYDGCLPKMSWLILWLEPDRSCLPHLTHEYKPSFDRAGSLGRPSVIKPCVFPPFFNSIMMYITSCPLRYHQLFSLIHHHGKDVYTFCSCTRSPPIRARNFSPKASRTTWIVKQQLYWAQCPAAAWTGSKHRNHKEYMQGIPATRLSRNWSCRSRLEHTLQ